MSLPADVQAHLLAAFQARIAGDDVIPVANRYRMYAEKVVHHPLSSWQALSLEEARQVFRQLGKEALVPAREASEPPPWVALPEAELQTAEYEAEDDEETSLLPPAGASASKSNPYPHPDPGALLRLPGLFCPGRAVAVLPESPEPGRLYGIPVDQDWVTVKVEGKESRYHWASRRTAEAGLGSRTQFDAWLLNLASRSVA